MARMALAPESVYSSSCLSESKNILMGFMGVTREVVPSSTAVVGALPVPPSSETTPVAGLMTRMYWPENSLK